MSVKPAEQLWLPGHGPDESLMREPEPDYPGESEQLMELALERSNLVAALRRVERNAGSAGVDGMSVKELRSYLKERWPEIRQALLDGSYKPSPVRRVYIPKPGGGKAIESVKSICSSFEFKIVGEPVLVENAPDSDAIARLSALGKALAEAAE